MASGSRFEEAPPRRHHQPPAGPLAKPMPPTAFESRQSLGASRVRMSKQTDFKQTGRTT